MPNGPTKIVLINAGTYDYAEVELNGSIQLVGPNNLGKTTLINTLQFLYLDDLRTTNFGSYDLAQTLAYYFPNQYSYVLFECLGATGQCVVGWHGQSKTSGDDPERFCYLGTYDDEDFFAGKKVREPRDVKARLALKSFRQIKTAQEHREMLLPPIGGDGKGLGIVALRDADHFRRFRESLKDLLSLGSITQEQMRERLLTLASVRSDVPALDVRKLFGDDYDKIRKHRDALARFKKNEEQVRLLVQHFAELAKIRGELISRWDDLRNKRTTFENAHTQRLQSFRETMTARDVALREIITEREDRQKDFNAQIGGKAVLEKSLNDIDILAKTFSQFDPNLAQAAEQNLKNEELRLKNLLAEAQTETREKAKQKIDLYTSLVQNNKQAIENFDRLAVTALRRHFKDDELGRAFRILNFELLETPIGADGICVRDEKQLLALVRSVAIRVRDGVYEDENAQIRLGSSRRSMSDLANVDVLRERLKEENETLEWWERILKAIANREKLAVELKQKQAELAQIQKDIFGFEQFSKARAEEPRLKRDLKLSEEALGKLKSALDKLKLKQETTEKEKRNAENGIRDEEDAFNAVMGRFNGCETPQFAVKVHVDELPPDFDSAIALFLKRREKEEKIKAEVESSLRTIAQLVGEQFNGADDVETIKNLSEELEALPEKTDALEHDWNALIQGLRGQFANVLKELDEVRIAATDLTKQFGKVQVSNLQTIKLEVLDAGDLVSWIKRLVNLQQPSLFDPNTQVDQTLNNFRQKFEGSSLISFSQLFSLQFAVTGADGVTHRYQDFRQIESDGTTIAIKVLFNLLVLRRYLREDQCVVPFFLDEIQALDPANRSAVLSMARKLGFLAITAAPEAVSEVDGLYFLQATKGRIVLRDRHRVGVKPK